jgi:hypothetical protein
VQLQLATLFVASQLQIDSSVNDSSQAADGDLQNAYAALLLQALLQQQVQLRIVHLFASVYPTIGRFDGHVEGAGRTPGCCDLQGVGMEGPANSKKAAKSAADALLAVLQGAMKPPAYAAALVSLACSAANAERVRRKALRLLVAAAERTGQQLAAADLKQRPALMASANAALAICTRVSAFCLPGEYGPV